MNKIETTKQVLDAIDALFISCDYYNSSSERHFSNIKDISENIVQINYINYHNYSIKNFFKTKDFNLQVITTVFDSKLSDFIEINFNDKKQSYHYKIHNKDNINFQKIYDQLYEIINRAP